MLAAATTCLQWRMDIEDALNLGVEQISVFISISMMEPNSFYLSQNVMTEGCSVDSRVANSRDGKYGTEDRIGHATTPRAGVGYEEGCPLFTGNGSGEGLHVYACSTEVADQTDPSKNCLYMTSAMMSVFFQNGANRYLSWLFIYN